MRVLIIGGTAFTGPHIVRRLHALGHEVILFNRRKTPFQPPGEIRLIQGDRHEILDRAAELRGLEPDVVLHMIPLGAQDLWTCQSVFRGVARRLIVISSQDVYRAYGRLIGLETGPPDPVPLSESAPLRSKLFPYRERVPGPDDPMYHYDKIMVERLALSDPELPGTVLRYPMVYGPGDRQHRLHPYLKRMDDGRPAIFLPEAMAGWRWTKAYAEDAALAVVLALTHEKATGRTYNVGEMDAPTEAEWVAAIAREAGWQGRIVPLPPEKLAAHLRQEIHAQHDLVTDTTRIRGELGYAEAVSSEEALRRAIAWERDHPPPSIDPKAFDYEAEDSLWAELG